MDVEQAAELYGRGLSLREVARVIGVSPNTVRRHILQAGVTMRPSGQRGPQDRPEQTARPRPRRYPDREQPRPWGRSWPDPWPGRRRSACGAVAGYLRRTPSRAELNAARRAAHGLADDGLAKVLRVKPPDAGPGSGYLILARPRASKRSIRDQGNSRPPARRRGPTCSIRR